MSKKKLITKRELGAVLRESVKSPNSPGPLRIMVEVGSHRYYRQRALELISLSLETSSPAQKQHYLEQAISLLGIAKYCIRVESIPDVSLEPGGKVEVNRCTLEQSRKTGDPYLKEILKDRELPAGMNNPGE